MNIFYKQLKIKHLNTTFFSVFFIILLFFIACSNKSSFFDYTKLEIKDVGSKRVAYFEGKRFTGETEYRMKNGNLLLKYNFLNGLHHGAYETYYSNGKMQKEGTYNKGKQHGEYKEYYETGQLKYWYVWDNDKKNGDWKSFYEDGAKWTLRQFKQDKLDGKLYVWDETGRLGKEHTYKNGYQLEKFNHFENFDENK